MNMTRDRVQSIGWATLLVFCTMVTGALMLRVNAVKSQVEITQRQIIALRRESQFLETEYETRANQQQLASINDLDFGYKAPDAQQYLENERQLAVLGKPRGPDSPAPIELANADDSGTDDTAHNGNGDSGAAPASLSNLVPQWTNRLASHLVGRAMAAEVPRARHAPVDAADLRERLARIDPPEHSE